MKRFALSGVGLAAAAITGVATTTAHADVTVDVVADTGSAAGCWAGAQFTSIANPSNTSGTLTGLEVNVSLSGSGGSYTYANDLTVLVLDASTSSILVQYGGYSSFGASITSSYSGSSSASGTSASGTLSGLSIDMTNNVVLLGNGYGYGTATCWNGTVTLIGASSVGGPSEPVCGDGICDDGEDCPDDCGPSNPCDEALSECAPDLNADGIVNTSDLLDLIGNFGSSGDGTFRPIGDIAPGDNGDCLVNTADLLALIGVFGSELDCTPVGPVCGDGICDEGEDCFDDCGCPSGTLEDCADAGECIESSWQGDGFCDGLDQQYGANLCCYENDGGDCTNVDCGTVTCGDGLCEGDETYATCPDDCDAPVEFGACCLIDGTCIDADEYGNAIDSLTCSNAGGIFNGAGSQCTGFNPVSCADLTIGDSFDNPQLIGEGDHLFDTTTATDSGQGQADDSLCSGTYFTVGGPDRWFAITPTTNGNMTVSTCLLTDDGYDTNLSVYEGLSNPLACNGDACSDYTSEITGIPVSAGRTYQIQVNGYNQTVGTGTLRVSIIPTDATGACCLADGSCDEITLSDCDAASGVWSSVGCSDVLCAQPLVCNGDAGEYGDYSTGALSDFGAGYNRAQLVPVSSITSVSILGLEYNYDPAVGYTGGCDEVMTFDVTIYEDAGGLPGGILYSGLFADNGVNTGNTFGDTFVQEYTFDLDEEVVTSGTCWISVQGGADSVSEGDELSSGGCWLLQVDVTGGTNYGVINDGSGWAPDSSQLAICVTGLTSGDVCGDGFCSDSESFETCPDDCVDPDACPPGDVVDCDGSGECQDGSWIGDGYCDGDLQAYGADLCCYETDGGDCTAEECDGDASNG